MYQNQLDFVCDYCSRPFTRKYNLQTHIENCHVSSSCRCEVCGQNFGSPAGLLLHYSRGHNNYLQPFPECEICGRIFTRKQNIMSHMITVHLQGLGDNIKCRICDKTFTTERNLKRHNKLLHNPDVKYPTCNDCGKIFKGKHTLIAHIQTAHNGTEKETIQCNLCDRAYTNARNLKRHVDMFHGEKEEYRCDICPKVYTSSQSLRRHARTTHSTDSQDQYPCTICSTLITGKENYDSHVQIHYQMEQDVKPYTFACETCSDVYSEEKELRQHIKNTHHFDIFYQYCKQSLLRQYGTEVERDYNGYTCEFCPHSFSTVYELKDHMRCNHDTEYSSSTCNVCFTKFFSKEAIIEHKKMCLPPPNVNSCSFCDKLFTDISSLEFHRRIFHPQAQIADSNITSTNIDEESDTFRCHHCDRVYFSERSLKHHVKLKHTTDEQMECHICGKSCSNKYYLASHIKMAHNNETWSNCEYCDKQFKSKRNIRRHIEYTHLGMQRHKCIECETLFKEKRSLRKHVRSKHPHSSVFPQCHICHKRFESAKSCKIHLKLVHSFNMNTFPCHLCSVSFSSSEALTIHLKTKHLAADEIYKCEECNIVFKGQDAFDQHKVVCHVNLVPNVNQKVLPRCILCVKDFSTRKTLKRHIKKFHTDFEPDELANFGSRRRVFNVDCEDCIKKFSDESYYKLYLKVKHLKDSKIFKCENCRLSYNTLEFAIQRHRALNSKDSKSKMILSELCTAEMSEEENEFSEFGTFHSMLPESTTNDIKLEPPGGASGIEYTVMFPANVKLEPQSP